MAIIESYRFGSIRVDGVDYRKDLLILRDRVISPWFRQAGGHVFALPDLEPLLQSASVVVVMGTGYWGRVRVPDETVAAFTAVGSQLIIERSREAVECFNRCENQGRDVVAALHLTC